MLNCDFLTGLANELKISDSEKTKLDNMLHPKGASLFLVQPLDDLYRFADQDESSVPDIHFSWKKLEVPVTQLAFQSAIRITVSEGGTETVYDDWELDKVDRKTKGDVNTFYAVFESKGIGKQKYSEDSTVKVEVIPPEGCSYKTAEYTFKVNKGKKRLVSLSIPRNMSSTCFRCSIMSRSMHTYRMVRIDGYSLQEWIRHWALRCSPSSMSPVSTVNSWFCRLLKH
jgi:hypothetical protein